MKKVWLFTGAVIAVVAGTVTMPMGDEVAAPESLIAHVDPFIGVDKGGNTVPGAGVPFGFVRLSPDTTTPGTSAQSR